MVHSVARWPGRCVPKTITCRINTMLNHVSIGVHDIGRAQQFYDAVMKELGYRL
jgi:hypothetical protein